jgi:hypothetical protein
MIALRIVTSVISMMTLDDLGDYRGFVPKKVSKSTIFWTFLYLLPMAGIGIR